MCGVEGDTKLSSRLGSAALAVTTAAAAEPQLAVTKDSLPGPVAVSQSDNRANITQNHPTSSNHCSHSPLTSHGNILDNILCQYYRPVSASLSSVDILIKIETCKPHNLAKCNYSCNKNL